MPGLLWAQRAPIPASETEVRSTITMVDDSAPSAAETAPPNSPSTFSSDPDTEGGLTEHNESAYRIPSRQYVPDIATANNEGPEVVNRRISSSGTAAAREAAGEWGHGTFNYSQSITPAFPDGSQFGADYFSVERSRVVSDMMTPARSTDPATSAAAQATAVGNARDAVAQSQTGSGPSPYQALIEAYMRGAGR